MYCLYGSFCSLQVALHKCFVAVIVRQYPTQILEVLHRFDGFAVHSEHYLSCHPLLLFKGLALLIGGGSVLAKRRFSMTRTGSR
jgi:hypothetical protein